MEGEYLTVRRRHLFLVRIHVKTTQSGHLPSVTIQKLLSSYCTVFNMLLLLFWFLDTEMGPQALPTLFFLRLVLSDFHHTKVFSFYNRSSLNLAYRLVTILSTIAPCRIFKLIITRSHGSVRVLWMTSIVNGKCWTLTPQPPMKPLSDRHQIWHAWLRHGYHSVLYITGVMANFRKWGFMGGCGVKVQHFPLTLLVVLTTLILNY